MWARAAQERITTAALVRRALLRMLDAVMPPVMALLALMALVQAFHLSATWLAIETVLLVAGTALGWWPRATR